MPNVGRARVCMMFIIRLVADCARRVFTTKWNIYYGGLKKHYQSSLTSRSWWSHSHKEDGKPHPSYGIDKNRLGGANACLSRALDRLICTRDKNRNAVPPTVEASLSRKVNLHGRGDDLMTSDSELLLRGERAFPELRWRKPMQKSG